ncbi:MAG: T9SS type A sorting domain-containing protein [Bacteroidales bacterium]
MKKFLIISIFFILLVTGYIKAQVLNVPQVIQEQSEWCWAGVTKCVLDYYGYPNQQCTIAEYARTVITWTNYGSVNCCVDPNQGCNYWNYNYGYTGSIQDILVHFGNIQNYGIGNTLTLNQINTEIAGGRPFIVRWQWTSGGGHFVVGHGVGGSNVYYMNPWFGEGLHISTYSWLVNDGNHTWTHTNVLTTSPTGLNDLLLQADIVEIYPNPTGGKFTINSNSNITSIEINNVLGEKVYSNSKFNKQTSNEIDLSNSSKGIYFVKIYDGEKIYNEKIVIQ